MLDEHLEKEPMWSLYHTHSGYIEHYESKESAERERRTMHKELDNEDLNYEEFCDWWIIEPRAM